MPQQWRYVPEYDRLYEVSDDGVVRRVWRYGRQWIKPLKPHADKDGYHRVTLCKDHKTKTFYVHRLVASTFIKPIPPTIQVNHKNGVKNDNRLENLELVTPSENTRHGFSHLGRKPQRNPVYGSRNGRAKLTEADVSHIRELLLRKTPHKEIAQQFGISESMVSHIKTGRSWSEPS